jgi:intracellular multiplication protein IcmE
MTNNENDIDIDAQEDFEKEPQQKATLKETWDSNPLLKIAAVILGLALLGGGYFIFLGNEEEQNRSAVIGDTTGAKQTVGQDVNDPEYVKKLTEQNKKLAEQQKQGGGSFVPTPIAPAENQTLALPATPNAPQGDPLAEWRAKTEAKRVKMEQEQQPEEKEVEQPEVVPMVTPIHPQPTMKMDPNAARQLAEQMRTIITTQTPAVPSRMSITTRPSAWTQKVRKDEEEARRNKGVVSATSSMAGTNQIAGERGIGGTAGAPAEAKKKTIVTAGTIAYAQLINDLNSDVKGPALAQVLSGPFAGGRAIGSFQKQEEYLTLNFTHIIKDGVSYTVTAIALDENTTLTGINSDVDHHYFARIVVPAAANFIKGYAQAASQPEQTQTALGAGISTTTSQPTTREQLMKGVTEAANETATVIKESAPKEITVKLWHGTTMGLLFTSPVTTGDAEQ